MGKWDLSGSWKLFLQGGDGTGREELWGHAEGSGVGLELRGPTEGSGVDLELLIHLENHPGIPRGGTHQAWLEDSLLWEGLDAAGMWLRCRFRAWEAPRTRQLS